MLFYDLCPFAYFSEPLCLCIQHLWSLVCACISEFMCVSRADLPAGLANVLHICVPWLICSRSAITQWVLAVCLSGWHVLSYVRTFVSPQLDCRTNSCFKRILKLNMHVFLFSAMFFVATSTEQCFFKNHVATGLNLWLSNSDMSLIQTSHWSLIDWNSMIAVRRNETLLCYSSPTLEVEIRRNDVEAWLLSSSVAWPFHLTCCAEIKSTWLFWQLEQWETGFASSVQWLHSSVMMYRVFK